MAAIHVDYWSFDAYFFHSELKDPKFHEEIVELALGPDRYVGIAAPRGHAKTTRISVRGGLFLLLNAHEEYILQVSDTYSQAVSVVAAIRYQISHNDKIKEIYRPQILRDKEDDLIIETIYGRSRIAARGTGQSLRGILDETETRPTLINCDDLENDERVENVDLRLKDWEWFWSVLIPARSRNGKVRVIGTILHKDSMLKKILNHEGWVTRKYSVKVAEGETIWPEHMDWDGMLDLMEQFRGAGVIHKFYCEYFNEPTDAEDAEFQEKWIQVVQLKHDTISNMIVTSTIDPAISKRDSACYTAITTCAWGIDNPPTMYVLDVRRGRWGVYETINQMFSVHASFGTSRFGIEKVAYQEALKEVFEMEQQRRQVFVNVELLPAKDSRKEDRIRALHSMYARGQVKWANEFPLLREEHSSFPHGITRDCIDAEAYQPKLYSISPQPPKPKPKQNSGGFLIDSIRKIGPSGQLGAY